MLFDALPTMTGQDDDAARPKGDLRTKTQIKREDTLSLSEELFKEHRNSGSTPLPVERRESLDFATLLQMHSDELLSIAKIEGIANAEQLDRQDLIFQVLKPNLRICDGEM